MRPLFNPAILFHSIPGVRKAYCTLPFFQTRQCSNGHGFQDSESSIKIMLKCLKCWTEEAQVRSIYYRYLCFALQTSNTILWILYSLARNPNVQKQLHEEVSSGLKPGERATLENLQKMPLLRGCIKESLR